MKKISLVALSLASATMVLTSCKKDTSNVTGWDYNDEKNGGFEKVYYEEQETGPGLILIEGGTFAMGRTEQDITIDWDNIPRRVTVSSFYMDETEISNIHYREYLYWLENTFSNDTAIMKKALPDTLVWREELAYNEPYVEYYFRYPSYNYYPVVGVTWQQAHDFCIWRTDRVNELNLNQVTLTDVNAAAGQRAFMDPLVGRCNECHGNAGANVAATGKNGNFFGNFERFAADLPAPTSIIADARGSH